MTGLIAIGVLAVSITKPYEAPYIPPVNFSNSQRIQTVMRAGMIYLTLEDAIDLALENNPDLASQRYAPLIAEWALKRAQAGGAIRGVPSASAQVSSVNNGVGVNGSTASAGLGGGGNGGNSGGGGSASIQQVGAVTPNLDPVLQNSTTFSHLSQPLANTLVSRTTALVQGQHTYNTTLQLGLISGGYVQLRDYEQYLKENAPSDALNPALGPHIDLSIRHNLLRGFGVKLNARSIRVAKWNIEAANETLRLQTMNLVATVTNAYWDLVAAADTLKSRQKAVELATQFENDTRQKIAAGALARVEQPRASAELAARQQDLTVASNAVLRQQEILRVLIVREMENAAIVPLDSLPVPTGEDDLPPLRDLIAEAMQNRPELAIAKLRSQAAELSSLGTANPLLPSLQVSALTYNRGVAGTPQASGGAVNPYFAGGYGAALGQLFRRNFPNESAGISFSASLENRQAQGDYGIDQLQLRQSTLRDRRDNNQLVVDISNQLIALRQARARYATTTSARALQEELLTAEQQRFSYGRGTSSAVILAQRALVTAQIAESASLADWAHARVSLDQVLGKTTAPDSYTAQHPHPPSPAP